MAGGSPKGGSCVTVALNKKARRDYFVEEKIEAGLELLGSEVKSLRAGRASINEAYAAEAQGEFFLTNAHFAEYAPAGRDSHDPKRQRRLLLHRRQIDRLAGLVQAAGKTVVPLSLYFDPRGIAKVELGVATGKKAHDKRGAVKEREWQRHRERLLKRGT